MVSKGAQLDGREALQATMERKFVFQDLERYESQVYSQCGEDGVIARIFECIGVTSRSFVEFGAKDGVELSNTANLRLNHGWHGLLMDGDADENDPLVRREFITAENINDLLEKWSVPAQPDLMSIDLDGNDYWVWKALEPVQPRVVIVEYNVFFGLNVSKTIAYNPNHVWDTTRYHGASLAAMHALGDQKGYSLVYTDTYAPNAYFVLRSALPEDYVELPLESVARDPWSEEPADAAHRDWVVV
jgi:hypothetical protein